MRNKRTSAVRDTLKDTESYANSNACTYNINAVHERYEAFDTAVYYLGFKDRTEKELRDKLIAKGYSEAEISEAIYKLAEYGYVDDSRYVRSYIRQNSSKKGRRLLISELKNKGIDKEIIIDEAKEIDLDEKQVIEDIFEKRFLNIDLSIDKQYRRVFSYFVRRGFSYDDITHIMAKYRKFDKY